MFELHPRLKEDCIAIGRFPLCRLLLMNDSTYPWFILVPERADIREIHELTDDDQIRLIGESSRLSRWLAESLKAEKINVAALGNMVPQLHWHVIVRHATDPAWPGPVWGKGPPKPYFPGDVAEIRGRVIDALGETFVPID
jgi:diadenosine tetraphosphate (Ap4A) HIT family hydrolase